MIEPCLLKTPRQLSSDIGPECPFRMPVYTVFTVFLDTPDVNNLFKL